MQTNQTKVLYDVDVEGHRKRDPSLTVHKISCVPAHEQVAALVEEDAATRRLNDLVSLRLHRAPRVISANGEPVAPVALYVDATPYSRTQFWLSHVISGSRGFLCNRQLARSMQVRMPRVVDHFAFGINKVFMGRPEIMSAATNLFWHMRIETARRISSGRTRDAMAARGEFQTACGKDWMEKHAHEMRFHIAALLRVRCIRTRTLRGGWAVGIWIALALNVDDTYGQVCRRCEVRAMVKIEDQCWFACTLGK